MRKAISTCLLLLTTAAVLSPNAPAHNPDKYTNVPFVIPTVCSIGSSTSTAKFINSNGQLQLQVILPPLIGTTSITTTKVLEGGAGFEVACVVPGQGGASLTGSFSQGMITFSQTGIPAGIGTTSISPSGSPSGIAWKSNFSDGTFDTGIAAVSSTVTIPVTKSGSGNATSVTVNVFNSTGSTISATLSNFQLNGKPILLDTIDTTNSCALLL